MKIPKMTIGKSVFSKPYVQGSIGVRGSKAPLVAAVANEGCLGTLTTIGLRDMPMGIKKHDFIRISNEALAEEIYKLKKITNKPFAVNVMGALSNHDELTRTAVECGANIIVYGAGIPKKLPEVVEDPDVALVPIVSSAELANLILRLWSKRYNRLPDAIIIEGIEAAAHLGFTQEQLNNKENYSLDKILIKTLETIKPFEDEFGKKIPLITAGGIYTGSDIGYMLSLGASGVQLGTRFVATHECSMAPEFKKAYIDAKKEDIIIIKSPVGMLARAIKNPFLNNLALGKLGRPPCFYHCISSCKMDEAGFCIAKRLVSSYEGDVTNGLIYAGANVHRIDRVMSVKELVAELTEELESVTF